MIHNQVLPFTSCLGHGVLVQQQLESNSDERGAQEAETSVSGKEREGKAAHGGRTLPLMRTQRQDSSTHAVGLRLHFVQFSGNCS